jgi:CRISPR-associated exonuclease Cas4
MFDDEDLLPLSALQHLLFCERQCALIHIEQVWLENVYTMEGRLLHERAHGGSREKRRGSQTEFGMPIRSLELGLVGRTDSVEYRDDGTLTIIEYKRGRPKKGRMDEVQLCAQALCLEEMLKINIAEGCLYYGKNKRRKDVFLDEDLRRLTRGSAIRLHDFIRAGVTPPPVEDRTKCPRCSLREVCLPEKLSQPRGKSVDSYYKRMLNTMEGE